MRSLSLSLFSDRPVMMVVCLKSWGCGQRKLGLRDYDPFPYPKYEFRANGLLPRVVVQSLAEGNLWSLNRSDLSGEYE